MIISFLLSIAKILLPVKGKRYVALLCGISLSFLLLFIERPPCNASNTYLENLLQLARNKELHKTREWEILLHYKDSLHGKESLIDDPRFFLSEDGKTDPQRELEETIRAFFRNDVEDDDHPRCKFIARYNFLKEKLSIDESKLPQVSCNEFNSALRKINPKSAVLVFPAAYMNSPASMFGHTLIRIDTTYESKLLSYAANYAAKVEDTSGIIYAFKGLFGYYKGFFSVLPYYEKVKEYSDLEHRDMWEFKLNLSEDEVKKMVMHLWELKNIYSYYYFFDENCSYNLLFLLEAARPSLNLTSRFSKWVIPVDTLRAVIESGLVESVVYRPSQGSRIRYIASLTSKMGQIEAVEISKRGVNQKILSGFDDEEKKRILDLAIEIIHYRYNRKEIKKDEYQRLYLNTLKARSEIGKSPDKPYEFPTPEKPHDGHLSGRISFGSGFKNERFFQEFQIRPAYHELTDPDNGFIEGSQIVFMGITARHEANEEPELREVRLIDILSVSPRDIIFRPLSWKVKTGMKQKILPDEKEHPVYYLNPGAGYTYKSKIFGLIYSLFETELQLGQRIRDNYALGFGFQVGAIKKFTKNFLINISTRAIFFGLSETHELYEGSINQVFRLSQNFSLNISFNGRHEFSHTIREAKINLNIYF